MVRSKAPAPVASGVELRAKLRAARDEGKAWEVRYTSLEYAVLDAGHDPYIPCPLAGEGCGICATVRRMRATDRVGRVTRRNSERTEEDHPAGHDSRTPHRIRSRGAAVDVQDLPVDDLQARGSGVAA